MEKYKIMVKGIVQYEDKYLIIKNGMTIELETLFNGNL